MKKMITSLAKGIIIPTVILASAGYGISKAQPETIRESGTTANSASALMPADCETLNQTKYGTVDWSEAGQGYLTFTAIGQERIFILQGPTGRQTFVTVKDGSHAKIALDDGGGTYQYAIANDTGEKTCPIMYKNSFYTNRNDA